MNAEEDEFQRIEAEAKRRAAQQALTDERNFCPRCGKRTKDIHTCTPPQQQAETPPEWPLIKNILAEYGLDAIAFVAEFKAAQRPWVGLTDNDWGWVADRKGTSLDSFDQGAAWAQQRLQERNT